MDEALVLSGERTDRDVPLQRQEPQPPDELQKSLQVDLRPVDVQKVDVQKVACSMAQSVESVGLAEASGAAAGSQVRSSPE